VGEDNKARQNRKFVRFSKQQHPVPEAPKNTVINLSNQELEEGTLSLLQKGLNYAVTPRATPIEDILVGIETAIRSLPMEKAEARQEAVRIIKTTKRNKDNLTKKGGWHSRG
jgi:hypothetical protein